MTYHTFGNDRNNLHPVKYASGSSATFASKTSNIMSLSGTGAAYYFVGGYITIIGANTSANNGTFFITGYSGSNILYYNANGVVADANNGSISWKLFSQDCKNSNSGTGAALGSPSGSISTVTSLANMTTNSVGNYLALSNSTKGLFRITEYVSATSVKVLNTTGTSDSSMTWTEISATSAGLSINGKTNPVNININSKADSLVRIPSSRKTGQLYIVTNTSTSNVNIITRDGYSSFYMNKVGNGILANRLFFYDNGTDLFSFGHENNNCTYANVCHITAATDNYIYRADTRVLQAKTAISSRIKHKSVSMDNNSILVGNNTQGLIYSLHTDSTKNTASFVVSRDGVGCSNLILDKIYVYAGGYANTEEYSYVSNTVTSKTNLPNYTGSPPSFPGTISTKNINEFYTVGDTGISVQGFIPATNTWYTKNSTSPSVKFASVSFEYVAILSGSGFQREFSPQTNTIVILATGLGYTGTEQMPCCRVLENQALYSNQVSSSNFLHYNRYIDTAFTVTSTSLSNTNAAANSF